MKEIVHLFLDNAINQYKKSFNLITPSEKIRLVIVYFCQTTDSLDIDVSVRHLAPDTHSEIYVYGILKDRAKKSCRLNIDFERGCTNSSGIEREEVFLLSNDVVNFSLPTIHCGEKDVHGVHGASIGQLDKEQLSYLLSRGLTHQRATSILIKAKVYQSLAKISDSKLKNSTKKLLDKVEW